MYIIYVIRNSINKERRRIMRFLVFIAFAFVVVVVFVVEIGV